MNSFEDYAQFQKSTQTKDFDIKYMAIGLGGEVGELLNEIKKMERDDNNILTKDRKQKIILEIGDILWYLQGLSSKLNITLDSALQTNIDKLSKRYNSNHF